MIGPSKILTVSYGTFSCTLEGFDEPFGTMKAIAEYFRDLAERDRYFGAVPPTPDAEMLHRIAEREIHRRVEARVDDNGIVLRQAEPSAAPVETVPASEPARPVAPAAAVVADVVAPVVAAPVAPMPPFSDDDSIAAKLSRIRAVVAQARTAVPAVEEEDGYDTTGFDATNGIAADFGFELDMADSFSGAGPASVPDDALIEPSEESAEYEIAATVEEVTVEAIAAEPVPSVEAPEEAAAVEAGSPELETAEAETEVFEADDDVAATLAAVTNETAGADAEPVALAAPAPVESDAEVLARLQAIEDFVSETEAETYDEDEETTSLDFATEVSEADVAGIELAEEDLAEEVAVEDDLGDDGTDAIAEALAEVPAEPLAAETGDEAVDAPEFVRPTDADLTAAVAFPDESLEDDFEAAADEDVRGWSDEVEAEVAEVVDAEEKPLGVLVLHSPLPRELIEAQTDAGTDDSDAQDDMAWDAQDDVAEAELVDEVEKGAEDAAVLAGIGAALDQGEARAEAAEALVRELAEAEDESAREAEEKARAREARELLSEQSDDEASVERLMDEAKTKLEGAESRRRFSAISHLKAAVAATVADRLLKPKDAPAGVHAAPEEGLDRYRDDLSKAVRPRRPAAEGSATTQRPTFDLSRQAPLVLVSEQRIDPPAGDAGGHGSIRPRRVTVGSLALRDALPDADEDDAELMAPVSPEEVRNFAEFADRLGASSLAELLEAAAAYTATVEGQPHFSRPHILRKVAYVADDGEYSREDGLRSFGMLLRQGTITKVSRGQFALNDCSKFMAEARGATN